MVHCIFLAYHARPEAGLEEIRRRPRGGVDRGRVAEGGRVFYGQGLLPRVNLK